MSKSFDQLMGLSWIKYAVFFVLLIVFVFFVSHCDSKRVQKIEQNQTTKIENETLKENRNDANNLADQKNAIDAVGGNLIDIVLPPRVQQSQSLRAEQADNSQNRQNNIAESVAPNAAANSKDVQRLQGNYKLGVRNELSAAEILQATAAELLPVRCRIEKETDELGYELIDENDQPIYKEICE